MLEEHAVEEVLVRIAVCCVDLRGGGAMVMFFHLTAGAGRWYGSAIF